MTDENLLSTEQPQGISNSGMGSINSDLSSTPSATQKEEYVPQSRVSEIVHAERRRAYEKGLQEAAQRVQPQQQQQSTDNRSFDIDESKLDAILAKKLEAIEKKRIEEAQRLQQQQETQRLYSELGAKLEARRKVDPAIDEKLSKVNYFNDMPGLQYALNQFDNAGDLMAHLVESKRDAVIIDSLAKIRDQNGRYIPDAAIDELRRISDRLKQNEAAKTAPVPPSPVGQIETTVRDGVKVSGESSLKDFKRIYRT